MFFSAYTKRGEYMNFTDKFLQEIGLINCCPLEFRAIFYGQNTVHFESIKGLKSYSETEVRLYLKKKEIVIKGNGLSIARYCLTEVTIQGEITGFYIE